MEPEEIDQIKSMLEGGYLEAGRHRLEEILKPNPHDMQAWLLYVNSFKTIDTRIQILEACLRNNPGNPQVQTALETLKKKKSAAQVPAPPPSTSAPSQPKTSNRAEQISDWRDDLRVKGNSASELATHPQPLAHVESKPAWGYERPAAEIYKEPVRISRNEIDSEAREYIESRVQKQKSVSAGPLAWYEVWYKALTQPNVDSYDALRKNPYALPSRTYLWLIAAGLISGLLVWIALGFSSQYDQLLSLIEQDFPGAQQTFQAFMFCLVPLSGIMNLVNTAIGIGIQHLVAKLMGGEGKYSELLYLVAAYTAPISIASSILSLIPYAGVCLGMPLGFYSIYLNVQAIRSAHNLNSIKAFGVILGIFLVSLIFLCLIGYLTYSYIAPYIPV